MSKEKQNNDLVNTLITIADSSSKISGIPISKTKKASEIFQRLFKS